VDTAPSPWDAPVRAEVRSEAWCNICRWTGPAFEGPQHCEFATCPRCGSIARDRFLFWCFVARTPPSLRTRLLETSPRLGQDYRRAMERWFTYTCSDFDERAHAGTVRLDLQAIELPDASLDVILTPHVLEHVPETDRALGEIARVLAPGGRMYLQVPVLQGHTAPPEEPEFHGDDTPVFWRFGPDLTDRLRGHGFTTTLLSTEDWARRVRRGATAWDGPTSREFDVESLLAGSVADDLETVADDAEAVRLGFVPSYMFLTWEAIRAGR
jgi:SAM-dependent methyltransferase